jgi:hypothetical protein
LPDPEAKARLEAAQPLPSAKTDTRVYKTRRAYFTFSVIVAHIPGSVLC